LTDALDRSELARQLADYPRPRVEVTCEVCDKVFIGSPKSRYCSGACKVRAWRQGKAKPQQVKDD
jgi:hypothetical protein